MTRRAEHRIAAFIAKHQTDGEQNWNAKWISFRAIARYCADLRTPRHTKSGEKGARHAYRLLMDDLKGGKFTVDGRSRVLLLVSHGGKIHWITPSQLIEAEKIFPQVFVEGYLDKCWAPVGLIGQWFQRNKIYPPWHTDRCFDLHIPRKHPLGRVRLTKDFDIIDAALETYLRQPENKRSIRAAVRQGYKQVFVRREISGTEEDRLRRKLKELLDFRDHRRNA